MLAIDDLDDFAVIHSGDAIGEVEDARVVCDDDQRPLRAFGDAAQDFQHSAPGFMVEGAGGFVANDQLRIVHQRSGDRHPLLLPAAEL